MIRQPGDKDQLVLAGKRQRILHPIIGVAARFAGCAQKRHQLRQRALIDLGHGVKLGRQTGWESGGGLDVAPPIERYQAQRQALADSAEG